MRQRPLVSGKKSRGPGWRASCRLTMKLKIIFAGRSANLFPARNARPRLSVAGGKSADGESGGTRADPKKQSVLEGSDVATSGAQRGGRRHEIWPWPRALLSSCLAYGSGLSSWSEWRIHRRRWSLVLSLRRSWFHVVLDGVYGILRYEPGWSEWRSGTRLDRFVCLEIYGPERFLNEPPFAKYLP